MIHKTRCYCWLVTSTILYYTFRYINVPTCPNVLAAPFAYEDKDVSVSEPAPLDRLCNSNLAPRLHQLPTYWEMLEVTIATG